MRDGDETESFDGVKCKKATEKALLCVVNGADEWVPKSQISDDSEVSDEDDEGTLVVSKWLAETKGWI